MNLASKISSGRKLRVIRAEEQPRSNAKTDEACERANAFLRETNSFAALGLSDLSADARMLARLVLELCSELDAERSARVAGKAERERLLGIIGGAAYKQIRKEKNR